MPKFLNYPPYLLSLDINVILQILHVASSSNEDESSDMESFEFAICFRDLKCAFKLKPYLVSKSHTSQLYLPTALPSTSRWVPDSLLCCSLLCRFSLKFFLNVRYRLIQIYLAWSQDFTIYFCIKQKTLKSLCLISRKKIPWLVVGPELWTIRTSKDLITNPITRT